MKVLQQSAAAEQILVTASDLFYNFGISSVGVDRVAAESGVTKRTLYNRFGSKEALVIAYLRRREAQWRQLLAAELATHPVGSPMKILAVFDALATMHDESSKGCSAVNARAEQAPYSQGDEITAEVVAQKQWMRGTFEGLCADANLADPAALADQLQILLDGALVTFGTKSVAAPLAVAKNMARALLSVAEPNTVNR